MALMSNTSNQPGGPQRTSQRNLSCDVAIVGGGIAGLWLMNLLRARGYDVLLCEAVDLGKNTHWVQL